METIKEIHKRTLQRIEELATEYRSPKIPETLIQKANGILDIQNIDDAYTLSRKTLDRALVCFLALWAQKIFPGRLSIDSLEKDIKKQEVLARFLKDTDQEKGYLSQMKKIAVLKNQLKELLELKKV